jgi:hypothetical protein
LQQADLTKFIHMNTKIRIPSYLSRPDNIFRRAATNHHIMLEIIFVKQRRLLQLQKTAITTVIRDPSLIPLPSEIKIGYSCDPDSGRWHSGEIPPIAAPCRLLRAYIHQKTGETP